MAIKEKPKAETPKDPKPQDDTVDQLLANISTTVSELPGGATREDADGDQDPKGQPAEGEDDEADDVDEGTAPDGDKDPEPEGDGQPAKEEPKPKVETEAELAAKATAKAITEANRKTQGELDVVVNLLRGQTEKLDALKESQPKLFAKLMARVPDLYGDTPKPPSEAKDKFHALLETVLLQQEDQDFEEYRISTGLADGDFAPKRDRLKETARTLYEEGLVKDWKLAIRTAGNIEFPHLVSSPVDPAKLAAIRGQRVPVSGAAPAPKDDLSDDDRAIMRREGLTREQLKGMEDGEIFAPGILG